MKRHCIRTAPILLLPILLASCVENNEFGTRKEVVKQHWSSVRSQLKLQAGSESFKAGQMKQAMDYTQEAIALTPEAAPGYVLLAKILFERGETAAAGNALERAADCTDKYPQSKAEIAYLQGLIAQRYRQFTEAHDLYEQAFKLEPMNAHYLAAVAEMLVAMGRLDEALEVTRDRWTDFEQNATIRALAGRIYVMLSKFEQAADAYQDAARLAPDDKLLQLHLGTSLARAGRWEEACATLAPLMDTDLNIPATARVLLGRCYLELNASSEAKAVLRKATKTDPKLTPAWSWLARASLAGNDLLTARRAAQQAVALDRENPDHLLLLAYVCYRQGDYEPARQITQRVLARRPRDPLARHLRDQMADQRAHGDDATTTSALETGRFPIP